MHTLTILSVLFNLQFQDAVRDDCTRGDLHGNIAVNLNAVAILHTHLRAHIHTHMDLRTIYKIYDDDNIYVMFLEPYCTLTELPSMPTSPSTP